MDCHLWRMATQAACFDIEFAQFISLQVLRRQGKTMNLKYLMYFQTLAHCEHYGRASEELGVAQPSLSHAVDCLEKELGCYLFEKKGRNVVLTRQGRQYLTYVDNALRLLDDGANQLRKTSSGVIEIGFVSSVRQPLLSVIRKFQKDSAHQNCKFSLYEQTTAQLFSSLSHSRLDFILASSPGEDENFCTEPILQQEIVVIDSVATPHIAESPVTLQELIGQPFILHTLDAGMRKVIDKLFERCGRRPLVMCEASEDNAIVAMVAMGMGVALVTDSEDVRKEAVRLLILEDPYNYRHIYLTTRKGQRFTPAADKFLAFLRKELQKSVSF